MFIWKLPTHFKVQSDTPRQSFVLAIESLWKVKDWRNGKWLQRRNI